MICFLFLFHYKESFMQIFSYKLIYNMKETLPYQINTRASRPKSSDLKKQCHVVPNWRVAMFCFFYHFCRKLKKLLRRRKTESATKQAEELNKTLQRHEKDHILGPFVGLGPEYMEMSKSKHLDITSIYALFKIILFTPLWCLSFGGLNELLSFNFLSEH